jgi:hypothetical protein
LILSTTPLVRRSCGCVSEAVLRVDEDLQLTIGENAADDVKTVSHRDL